jgi:5-methylcytosine-specific restriction endonuclease McrA
MKKICKCGNKIIKSTALICGKCRLKQMRNSLTNPGYKDGRTLKTYFCKCGKELSGYRHKKCPNCSVKGRTITKVWAKKISKKAKIRLSISENNPNWKGGISFEEYGKEFDNSLKEQVRFRDKYKCQICGCSQLENSKQLDVHHKDYDKKNNNMNNLISLCRSCHIQTNYDRNYWTNYFNKNEISTRTINEELV